MTTIILQNNGARNIGLPGGQVFAKGKTMEFPTALGERIQRMYKYEVKSLQDLTVAFEAVVPELSTAPVAEEVSPVEEVKKSTKKERAKAASSDVAGDIEVAGSDLSLDDLDIAE